MNMAQDDATPGVDAGERPVTDSRGARPQGEDVIEERDTSTALPNQREAHSD